MQVRAGSGKFHLSHCLLDAAFFVQAKVNRSGSGRTTILSVVAMKIDWPWQITNYFGESKNLGPREVVFFSRKMDVSQPILAGVVQVRAGTVDRDDGLDAQFFEGSKSFISFWAAAADELIGDPIDVVQPLRFDLGRSGR